MTRQIRGNARRVAVAAVIAAATPLAALSVPSATAAPEAASAAAATAATASASSQYVVVTRSGSTRRLQLVDRRSGKVIRTLATATSDGVFEPFSDIDLATDGSVYAVVRRPGTKVGDQYGTQLVRYARGHAQVIMRYVTSAQASPDGRQLAVTVVSPDGDHDGKGLEALRIATPRGAVVRTLAATKFPVDKKTGAPQYETGGLQVTGWLGRGNLVVRTGCCSESDVHVVPAAKAVRSSRWASFFGQDDAMAIGVRGSSAVLAARPVYTGTDQSYRRVGLDVAWVSAAYPKGKVIERIKNPNVSVGQVADALNRKYRTAPLYVSPKRFPFRGSGTVLSAAV